MEKIGVVLHVELVLVHIINVIIVRFASLIFNVSLSSNKINFMFRKFKYGAKNTVVIFVSMIIFGMISCQHQREVKNIGITYIDFFKNQSLLKECDIDVENTYIILAEDSMGSNLLKQIDKIVVKDSIIYVADTYMKKLFLYDMNGHFISGVGEVGEGPNENLSLSDFCVDDKGNIYWYDGIKNRVQVYNNEYSLINHYKIPFKAECLQWDNGNFLFSLAPYNTDSLTKGKCLAYTDSSFVLQGTLLDYDDNVDLNVEFYSPFISVDAGLSYNRVVNNNVFILQNGGIEKSFFFDFGQLNVRDEYLSDLNRMQEGKTEYCYIASTPIFYKNLVLGCLNKSGEVFTFIFDLNKQKSYIGKLDEYDSNNINIPFSLSDSGDIVSFINQDIYQDFKNDSTLTEEMKRTLENGGFLVCFSKLNYNI